ncbi:MAG: T9SS type A sorting domain-containing protein [Bacteroidota bacterium]
MTTNTLFLTSTIGFISTTMPKLNKALIIFGLVIFSQSVSAQEVQSSNTTIATATWTGAVSADWCNSANWADGKIPNETSNTVIPAGTPNNPVVACNFSFNAFTGNIDVRAGATLTIPTNKTLNIYGNFINTNENNYLIAGRVNFSGQNQIVPGFKYHSLTVSGGGLKTLAGNATVNGVLVLTRGVIVTKSDKLLTLGYRCMITAGYGNAYVDGPLKRLTNAPYSYSFPVGAQGKVRSVVIAPDNSNEGSYTVYYHRNTTPDNGKFDCTNLLANQQEEYWSVSRSENAADAMVQMEYINSGEAKSWSNRVNPSEETSVAIIQNTNGSWSYKSEAAAMGLQSIESSTPAAYDGTLGSRLSTNNSYFTFGYGYSSILPIKLLSFSGNLQANDIALAWSVEQGDDVITTELQHGPDQEHFSKLASFQAEKGKQLNFDHNNLAAGPHYYRLLMKDKANNLSYSKTVLVIVPDYITRIKGLKATLVRNDAVVKIESSIDQKVGINLYDMAGHLVNKLQASLQVGDNAISVNTMMVTPGIYNMYVQTANGTKASLRFMKE